MTKSQCQMVDALRTVIDYRAINKMYKIGPNPSFDI
jgi:hypothetical protein